MSFLGDPYPTIYVQYLETSCCQSVDYYWQWYGMANLDILSDIYVEQVQNNAVVYQ